MIGFLGNWTTFFPWFNNADSKQNKKWLSNQIIHNSLNEVRDFCEALWYFCNECWFRFDASFFIFETFNYFTKKNYEYDFISIVLHIIRLQFIFIYHLEKNIWSTFLFSAQRKLLCDLSTSASHKNANDLIFLFSIFCFFSQTFSSLTDA